MGFDVQEYSSLTNKELDSFTLVKPAGWNATVAKAERTAANELFVSNYTDTNVLDAVGEHFFEAADRQCSACTCVHLFPSSSPLSRPRARTRVKVNIMKSCFTKKALYLVPCTINKGSRHSAKR